MVDYHPSDCHCGECERRGINGHSDRSVGAMGRSIAAADACRKLAARIGGEYRMGTIAPPSGDFAVVHVVLDEKERVHSVWDEEGRGTYYHRPSGTDPTILAYVNYRI